ncbi:MAG: CHAT domain-containing protein [Pseudomarimonas sp.]
MSEFDAWRRWAADLNDSSFERLWLALGAVQARQDWPGDAPRSLAKVVEAATQTKELEWAFPRFWSPFAHEIRQFSPGGWLSQWHESTRFVLDKLPLRIDVAYLGDPASAWIEPLYRSPHAEHLSLVLPVSREDDLGWPLRIGAATPKDQLLIERLTQHWPREVVSCEIVGDAADISCDVLVYTDDLRKLSGMLRERTNDLSARFVVLGSEVNNFRALNELADTIKLVTSTRSDGFVAIGKLGTFELRNQIDRLVSNLYSQGSFGEATRAVWGALEGRSLIGLSRFLAGSRVGPAIVDLRPDNSTGMRSRIDQVETSPASVIPSDPRWQDQSLGSIEYGSDEPYAGGLESFGEEAYADVSPAAYSDFSLEIEDLEKEIEDELASLLKESAAPAAEAIRLETSQRRLIADAWSGGDYRRAALLPDADHELHVRIAIPGPLDTAAQEDFPENELAAGVSAKLMVTVTSDELGLTARLPIVLSTANRAASSTTALFAFRTQSDGSVVDIKILVTFQERPLQEAHFVASVRARPLASDRAQLNAIPLSSSPEPIADATPAQVSLEVNGANLVRTGSGIAIDQTQLRGILDEIERMASRVLGNADAPETLDGESAEGLLISLARYGASIKELLAPLQIGDATTISLLINASTPLMPLELVYDAPTPRVESKLCEHRRGGAMVGKSEVCSNVGNTVVCPYAFWGQRRVIARTIRLYGEDARPSVSGPFNLRPVLYASVDRADVDSHADKKPSDILAAEIEAMVGTGEVMRVRDWDEWKRQVREKHPQLLVVLGHTESLGAEARLEIGTNSWLRGSDIGAEHLYDTDAARPLVVLLACATGVPRNYFGGLPGAFTGRGAAAVVATLTKLRGPHGAQAATAVVRALCSDDSYGASRLGVAMTSARHQLIKDGLIAGLFLVSHGEIDLPLKR